MVQVLMAFDLKIGTVEIGRAPTISSRGKNDVLDLCWKSR